MKRILPAGILWIVLLSGCFRMGPDFQKPVPEFDVPGNYGNAVSSMAQKGPSDRWWSAFGDADLDRAVESVIRNNLDIRTAVDRVLEVQSYFVQARADRYPGLSVQGEAKRQGAGGVESDSFTLSLPAAFEIDLWGRLARAEEAARADLLQVEENARTVSHTVIAEAVTLFLEIRSLEERIGITMESIENYTRYLSLIERRYEGGLTSILDVKQASRVLAQAEAALPGLRQERGITEQRLAVLRGAYPGTESTFVSRRDYFRDLDSVPPGLPSDLLLKRPDVRAAEANLRALNARVGVAAASRFPRISLTGSFGYSSAELERLIQPSSELWSLASGVVQPLFDGGKLRAGQRAAEARYREGVSEYGKTVLNAFADVEKALFTRKELLERKNRIIRFLSEARATQEVAENRYQRGLAGYLTVLDAQQTRFQAEDQLLLVDLALYTNRVSLHRALGGGWGDPLNKRTGEEQPPG